MGHKHQLQREYLLTSHRDKGPRHRPLCTSQVVLPPSYLIQQSQVNWCVISL